ncbi:MAG: hypothetical protein SOZ80_05225 [Prevotella sp.]|uniref:RAMP superfamily CRISPR-associated protein n=1 Tax=Prevotella sp. TaxID=59823 RepID=UPI002A32E6B2|nr:RAMP superfamily CRISPR-associated protein [Prevotella sp.]MDD7318487.1 hypothetical protein [Prevotellaceae bacterium]MDY4020162.1 hypothetical protein [Prevotella sp.]
MTERRYNIEFEVISPLSVCAGDENDWYPGIDFVKKDNKVHVLDIDRMLENGIDLNRLESYFQTGNDKGLSQIIGNKLPEVTRFVFQAPADTSNKIKSFMRTKLKNKPIVPGSSLKGAIRSALFNHIREREKDFASVYGSLKEGTDFMRFINVGDIIMSSTVLVNSKLFNLMKDNYDDEWYGGWKHGVDNTNSHYSPYGFNTLYECVKPGTKGAGTIDLKKTEYDLLRLKKKGSISHEGKKTMLLEGGLEKLFEAINNATRAYLINEIEFFEYYNSADRTEEIIDFLNELIAMIPKDNSYCIIKMSAGAGFHSITGNYQYQDFINTGVWENKKGADGKVKYKSRRVAEHNGKLQLMGFAKLKAISTDEAGNINRANIEETKTELDKKKIEEKKKREIMEREYAEFIAETKRLMKNKEWDKAMEKSGEAGKVLPNGKAHTELFNQCKAAKDAEIQDAANKLREESENKFRKPLCEAIKGVKSLGNLLGTTKKWMKTDNHTFGRTEFDALIDAIRMLPGKEQKKISKEKNGIIGVIGEEWRSELTECLLQSK